MKLTRNSITPRLQKLLAATKPAGREKILRAMGTTFLSITLGNFQRANARYRPTPWPNKKDGTPATLKKTGLLSGSFHLTVDSEKAELKNPTPYAYIHQYGGKTGRDHTVTMPARPFVPVDPDGKLTKPAETLIARAAERATRRQF